MTKSCELHFEVEFGTINNRENNVYQSFEKSLFYSFGMN